MSPKTFINGSTGNLWFHIIYVNNKISVIFKIIGELIWVADFEELSVYRKLYEKDLDHYRKRKLVIVLLELNADL